MKTILFMIIAYFIGAIPSGVWIGKAYKGIDIRNYGSKNSGATNSYRILGPKLGIAVFLADVLKGFIPLFIASFFINSNNSLAIIGLVAILAHTYSFYINFKGGKGVATSFGVFLFLAPYTILSLFLIFVVVVAISKYISLGSIVCAGLLPVIIISSRITEFKENFVLMLVSIIISVFVIYRHKTNIKRLLNGNENKFKFWKF